MITTRFLLLSDSCRFVNVGRSLTRERVCRLQLLLAIASAVILGSESRGTRDHILLSQSRGSPNLEGQDPVFIAPRNRVAQLYTQTLGSLFVASYDSQGYGGGIKTRFHAGSVINFRHGPHRKHLLLPELLRCVTATLPSTGHHIVAYSLPRNDDIPLRKFFCCRR
jgi:hypothetical protein